MTPSGANKKGERRGRRISCGCSMEEEEEEEGAIQEFLWHRDLSSYRTHQQARWEHTHTIDGAWLWF